MQFYCFSYYLNHYTKSTSWEDPRVSAKQHHVNRPVEHIPLQVHSRTVIFLVPPE